MVTVTKGVAEMVKHARAAVCDALAHSHPARAWELLQERDADGNAKGPLPYTNQALDELTAAHERNPEDAGVVHHLAIAHHARAWDLELQGDLAAVAEWENALGYWRMVASSGQGFWAGWEAKLAACDPNARPGLLRQVRRELLEYLLDIHVDFVRYYCEADTPDRATAHVQIVRRAEIPPAVKKRLVEKVFKAMIESGS